MNNNKTKTWYVRVYVNFFIALFAPVLLYYLIVVASAIIFDSPSSDDSGDTDENTWFEDVFPGEIFVFTGLFTYPAVMVLYFLYKGQIDDVQEYTGGLVEGAAADISGVRDDLEKLGKSVVELKDRVKTAENSKEFDEE